MKNNSDDFERSSIFSNPIRDIPIDVHFWIQSYNHRWPSGKSCKSPIRGGILRSIVNALNVLGNRKGNGSGVREHGKKKGQKGAWRGGPQRGEIWKYWSRASTPNKKLTHWVDLLYQLLSHIIIVFLKFSGLKHLPARLKFSSLQFICFGRESQFNKFVHVIVYS